MLNSFQDPDYILGYKRIADRRSLSGFLKEF